MGILYIPIGGSDSCSYPNMWHQFTVLKVIFSGIDRNVKTGLRINHKFNQAQPPISVFPPSRFRYFSQLLSLDLSLTKIKIKQCSDSDVSHTGC